MAPKPTAPVDSGSSAAWQEKSRALQAANKAQVEAQKALAKANKQFERLDAELEKAKIVQSAFVPNQRSSLSPGFMPSMVRAMAAREAQEEAQKAAAKADEQARRLEAEMVAAQDISGTSQSNNSGLEAALEASQAKADADQASFANTFGNNMGNAPAKRSRKSEGPAGPARRRQRARRAGTTTTNDQSNLFGTPIFSQSLSPEQIALERQRLTTAYDPLDPPVDDPTTAEGVRMGVVTDTDGRHWRQQSMRLGRWITEWKDVTPFASQPVDVSELSKAEKRWLDIKFRRRVCRRITPPKTSQGRGCTTRYWSSRSITRGVYSGRVSRPSTTRPPRGTKDPRRDDADDSSSSDDDGTDAFVGKGIPLQPNFSFPDSVGRSGGGGLPTTFGRSGFPPGFGPPQTDPDRKKRPKTPIRPAPLINGVLLDYGLSPTFPTPIYDQLTALLTKDVLDGLPDNPMAEHLPTQTREAMGDILKAAGLLPKKPDGPSAKDAGDQSADAPGGHANAGSDVEDFTTGNIAQGTTTPPPAPSFVDAARLAADQNRYWITTKAGTQLSTRPTDDPGYLSVEEDEMRRILVQADDDLSNSNVWVERQDGSTGARVWVRGDRTSGYMAVDSKKPDRQKFVVNRFIMLQLADQKSTLNVGEMLLGTKAEHDGAMIVLSFPPPYAREEPSTALVDLLHEGQIISVPRNKAGAYLGAVVNPPRATAPSKPKKGIRMVTLQDSPRGPEMVVPESAVGTLPEHIEAAIVSCDPVVDESEPASQRLVLVMDEGGDLERVPDNRLGSYVGHWVLGTVESPVKTPELSPSSVRTIDLRQKNGVEINVPVLDVNNFRFGGATIVRDSIPPATSEEHESLECVWISPKGSVLSREWTSNNFLGLLVGATISEPNSILPYRQVVLRGPAGTLRSVPVGQVSNADHQGEVVVATNPTYDSLERPSRRLVYIRTSSGFADMTVPDNYLGNYAGATILPAPGNTVQTPIILNTVNENRLILLTLPDGRNVRVPVASVGPEVYGGAIITGSEPAGDPKEAPSGRTVRVTTGSTSLDVPDKDLGLHSRGWRIATASTPTVVAPPAGPRVEKVLTATVGNAVYLTAEDIRKGGFITTAKEQVAIDPLLENAVQTGKPKRAAQAGTLANEPAQKDPDAETQNSEQANLNAMQTGNPGHQDPKAQAGNTTQADQTATADQAQEDPNTQTQRTQEADGTTQASNPVPEGLHTEAPNKQQEADQTTQKDPNKLTNNSKPADKTPPQSEIPTPPSETPRKVSDAEITEYFPKDIRWSEYIKPSNKPFPNGRPDNNNRWNQPPAPRGDPMEVERIRQSRERYVRNLQEALVAAGVTVDGVGDGTGPSAGPNIDPLTGTVTVTASGAPGAATATNNRSEAHGVHRADARPRATSAPAAPAATATTTTTTTTAMLERPQAKRTLTKSARVVKSGRRPGAERNVRFGPLPTEEEVGRTRGTGLRTRSGALYSPEGKGGSSRTK